MSKVTTDNEEKPITTEIIRNILDVQNKEYSNLKNLRIVALCSLAFAGFLRYDDNIVTKRIEFHYDYIRLIYIGKGNTSIYYMEESVLLETKPLVDSIRHFIRDPSGVFSVCHLC